KELAKLRAVEFALMRIEDGSYGHCEECEEEIGAKRLQTQPWADLCIVHAEERERENKKRAF
ncbi:MAG: DnaK suppressor protein, partial [Thermoproteota archaeon]